MIGLKNLFPLSLSNLKSFRLLKFIPKGLSGVKDALNLRDKTQTHA
jgi:hypothetical protein